MAVAVVKEGEGGVALSEVEDEGFGLAHADDYLCVAAVVGAVAFDFDLFFFQKPAIGGGREEKYQILRRSARIYQQTRRREAEKKGVNVCMRNGNIW